MYIAYIGTGNRYDGVQKVVKEHFGGDVIDPVFLINDAEDYNHDALMQSYAGCVGKYDGVLLSGILPFVFLKNNTGTYIPTEYIRKETSTLLGALLKAQLSGIDISRISIDTYEAIQLESILNSVGISITNSLCVVDTDLTSFDSVNNVAIRHADNYKYNNCSCCVTFMENVYKQLNRRGIPCILAIPSEEAVFSSIQRLHLTITRLKSDAARQVFAMVELLEPMSPRTAHNGPIPNHAELLKGIEQIYNFAGTVHAAVIQESSHRFCLTSNRDYFDSGTDSLEKNQLFGMVYSFSSCCVRMGIGYGKSADVARANAEICLQKALTEENDCAYIAYADSDMIGPVEYVRNGDVPNSIDNAARIHMVATKCELSSSTIMKLASIIKAKSKNDFTATELAQCFGISKRTMYRILDKLELNGYCRIIGQDINQNNGRPRRVYRFKL